VAGKWTGEIVWDSASGRDYRRTLHTAVFFLPHGVAGTVITFPTGAIGGVGTYTLQGGRLTVRTTGISLNGHPVPLRPYAARSWFRAASTYDVSFDGPNLTLTPAAGGPMAAPCYPLLTSPKPLTLSRVEAPMPQDAPAPKE
jgi:hypothetical protein